MSGILQVAGVIGFVFIFFGLVAYLFGGRLQDPYVLAHLGLGLFGLLIYLATQGRSFLRTLSRRSTRYGLHAALYSLLFLASLIMVNFLNLRHHARWDLTAAKVFTLSPQSAKVLERLQRDVEIYGFFERGENPAASRLIKSYTHRSPRIKFYPIDPDRHPELARQFQVRQFNTLHIRYGQEATNITETTEEAVTNAIAKLTKTTKKTIYFLIGHGEPRIDDRGTSEGYGAAKEALANENYQAQELLLSTQAKVPEQASLLIVAGPQKPLLDQELKAVDDYIKNAGRLLILLAPPGGDDLKAFLRDWGVEVGDDIVVDQEVRLFAGPSLGVQPIAEAYSSLHPITREFKERTIFPMVRSVEPAASTREGVQVTSLVKTSPSSWAEKDLAGIFRQGKASLGPEDKKGPVSVGVAVAAELKKIGIEKDGQAKIVALGTAEFANNRFIDLFFNRDFFLNAVNWLAEEESSISIRPRSLRPSRVQLSRAQGTLAFYLSFLILPEVLLIIGLGVWWKRR